MVADISRNASRLGARSGRLRQLSILGGRGRSKQNAERDYHRLREAEGLPIQTYFIYVPLRDANTGLETEWEWLPVLLPWKIVFVAEHARGTAYVHWRRIALSLVAGVLEANGHCGTSDSRLQ